MPQTEYLLRPATGADVPAMLEVLSQAKAKMHQMGIPQWDDSYPNAEVMRQDIAQNGCFALVDGAGEIVGTMALLPGTEPTYENIYQGSWPGGDRPYATIHRIAVANSARGTGAAKAMYTEAEALARVMGAETIRVDTHRQNLPMQRFLEKCGFIRCGIIYLADASERVSFEKLL